MKRIHFQQIFLFPILIVVLSAGIIIYTIVAPRQAQKTFVQSEAHFCFSYPNNWSTQEFNQDGNGVTLLDPTALREGVTLRNTDSLSKGAYVSLARQTIPEFQKDLPIFTPEGQLQNAIADNTFAIRTQKSITVDNEKGILAEIDPQRVDRKIPAGAAGLFRLEAFVRHGNTLYDAVGFFGTEKARSQYESTFKSILQTLKFPEHCGSTTSNANQSGELNPDAAIKQYVLSNSAISMKDISISGKTFITDAQGVQWLKFQIEPIPADASDPAYGIMKMVSGMWVGVGYGTCCIEKQLPQDVAKGLGFPITNE